MSQRAPRARRVVSRRAPVLVPGGGCDRGGIPWSAEAWSQVRIKFKKAFALRREIRRAGRFN